MKISKLTIAALLTMGMVLTGCNVGKKSQQSSETPSSSESSSSGSQVDPVSKIRITPLGRTLVVGDQINLDDYVNVVGGEGPKVYTATVKQGADAVTLEGKTLTAVAEGSFKIEIAAGAQTANFSGDILTALKAAFKDFIDSFPIIYGVQVQTYSAGEIVDSEGALVIHQEDYFGHYSWKSSAPKVGGYLKSGDGKMYKWSSTNLAGDDFKAIPGPVAPVSNWSNYFVNTPLYFNFADFAMTDYPESTEKLLAITDAAAPQADLVDYFNCAIDQLMYCGLGYDFEDDTNKTLYVHAKEKAEGGYDFSFELIYTDTNGTPADESDDEVYGFPFRFLTGTDTPVLPYVQEYVDSGEHPEAVSFAEYTAVSTAAITAKNYSYNITVGFFNSSTFAYYDPALTPDILTALGVPAAQIDYYANNAYYSLTESALVTATARYSQVTEVVFENSAISGTALSEFGYIEHEGALYRFSKADGAAAYTTTNTGAASLWTDAPEYAGASLVPDASFEVSSRTDNGDGTFTFGFAQGSASIGRIAGAIAALGRYNYYKSGQLTYMLGQLVAGADSFSFTFGVNFGGGIMWGAKIVVSGIGSATFPVAEDVIFPAA